MSYIDSLGAYRRIVPCNRDTWARLSELRDIPAGSHKHIELEPRAWVHQQVLCGTPEIKF
jgi:hypothetical protein